MPVTLTVGRLSHSQGRVITDMFGSAITKELQSLPSELQKNCQAVIAAMEQLLSQPVTIDQFCGAVMQSIHTTFDIYSANLYTIESKEGWVVLKVGSSEFAQSAVKKDHRLPLNEHSLVGKVAKTGQMFAAIDLGQHEIEYSSVIFHPVRSELAVPIISPNDNTTVGVLDIQSDRYKAFGKEHFVAFSTIANCIAQVFNSSFPNESLQ